jgi:hypothetical protein
MDSSDSRYLMFWSWTPNSVSRPLGGSSIFFNSRNSLFPAVNKLLGLMDGREFAEELRACLGTLGRYYSMLGLSNRRPEVARLRVAAA